MVPEEGARIWHRNIVDKCVTYISSRIWHDIWSYFIQNLSSIKILKLMYGQYICAYICMHVYIKRISIFSFCVGSNYYCNQISYVVLTNFNKNRVFHFLVCNVIILVISPGRSPQKITRNKTSKTVHLEALLLTQCVGRRKCYRLVVFTPTWWQWGGPEESDSLPLSFS